METEHLDPFTVGVPTDDAVLVAIVYVSGFHAFSHVFDQFVPISLFRGNAQA